jgi:hypothetical protein
MTAAEWAEQTKGASRSQMSDLIRAAAAAKDAKIPPGLRPWRKREPEEGDENVPA